jgi:DNA-binding IclR family transcriptional regulator
MKSTKEMRRHVEVVLKALDILDCFQSQPILTLKEIVDITHMTRSRAMRLMGTLESRGYLIYNSDRRNFQLGPRLLTLGKIFETHNTLISLARPILRDLVKQTGELASLYVIDGTERVALAREKGIHEISYTVSEGQRMELYAGAAGKVLLAYSPSEITKKVLSAKSLIRLTPNTITNTAKLLRQLEKIHIKGYSVSKGERALDVWSVAAPVFDHRGMTCCAIGITGPIYRIPKAAQSNFINIVIGKARELTRHIGGTESHNKKEDES